MDNIGGAEIVALTLTRELAADMYTTNLDADKIRAMGFADVLSRIHSIGKVPVNAPFRQQLASWKFSRLNLGKTYDLYIIAGDWALSGAVHNQPNIWYAHSPLNELWTFKEYVRKTLVPWWQRPFFDLWVGYNRRLSRKYSASVQSIVCNSENSKNRLKSIFHREAKIIYPPIQTSQYHNNGQGTYWLSVNRLTRAKRIEVQMKAFAKLPNERLVIVGSYEKNSKLFETYKTSIESIQPSNVTILNWVDDAKLKALYAGCKGFIATAMDEDFGMAPVEAMASGKPVITSREGGYRETVIDGVTGRLIDQIDETKLAQNIEEMAGHTEKYLTDCVQQAKKFDTKIFVREFKDQIAQTSSVPDVLFLSHGPHHCHQAFADSIGARTHVTPFRSYILLMKKYPMLNILYPALSLVYSLFLKISESTVLVEGGSSLYVAYFLKWRYPKLRIVYLDMDLLLYDLSKEKGFFKGVLMRHVVKKIDFCISGSAHSQRIARQVVSCPVAVAQPYPKEMQHGEMKRENFGLYVGRVDMDKNIRQVVAFGLQCPYFEKFIVVGDGNAADEIRELALHDQKLVYFPYTENVAEFYRQGKFLIHLPAHDTYPCTTLEAAVCGCFPMISQGVGTLDIFDDIFIVQDTNNFEKINQKIKYILDHEENCRELLRKNAEKILTKEESVENFKKVFSSICI